MNINVGFIGAGNMGTAIMKGIKSSSLGGSINLFAGISRILFCMLAFTVILC